MNEEEIIRISTQSTEDKINFLEAVKKMKKMGLDGYLVEVLSHNKIYFCGEKTFVQEGGHKLEIINKFDKNKIIETLRSRQQGKISFDQFMEGIASAGVFDYIVDLKQKKVRYRGLFEEYTEMIPI